MVDFVKKLKEKNRSSSFRQFEAVQCGEFKISIQASEFHYCTPRRTVEPYMYSNMEIAIFDSNGWVIPPSDDRFKNKPWANLFEEGSVNSVAGYVPVETIESIMAELEQTTTSPGRFVEID